MRKLLLIIILLCFGICSLWAQKPQNLKWGEIPAQDKTMTLYSPDSSADAVVLNVNYHIYFEEGDRKMVPMYKVHKRVKLLKQSALDKYGNLEIVYCSECNLKHINKLQAQVIQPNGTVIEIDNKAFITEKTSDKYSTRKCALPNLKIGSIIEYQYILELSSFLELSPCFLQESDPVRHAEVLFAMPDIYDYVYLTKGEQLITKKELPNALGSFFGYKSQIINTFLYADTLPALIEEKYITTMDDYKTQVKFQLKSYTNFGATETNTVMSNWFETARNLQEKNDFGNLYSKKGNYKDLWAAISPLLTKAKTEQEKAQIIYDYLNQNIKASKYGIWNMEKPDELFAKKTASFGELNIMLIACLREAGIKASPMLISTRSNGLPIKVYPILDQFNHLLCYANLDGTPQLIDAGNAMRPIDLVRIDAINHHGWILDKDNPQWLPIKAVVSNNTLMATLDLNEEGDLKGTINNSYKGYAASHWRGVCQEEDKSKALAKELKPHSGILKIENLQLENLDSLNNPFKSEIRGTIEQAATISNDLIYLNPHLFTEFNDNSFTEAQRHLPIDMPYPIKNQYILNLNLPKGYVIEEMPQNSNIALPENAATYKYSIANQDNKIQLTIKLDINETFYAKENYALIQTFFTHIADKQAEQIVLKKKK